MKYDNNDIATYKDVQTSKKLYKQMEEIRFNLGKCKYLNKLANGINTKRKKFSATRHLRSNYTKVVKRQISIIINQKYSHFMFSDKMNKEMELLKQKTIDELIHDETFNSETKMKKGYDFMKKSVGQMMKETEEV